MSSKNKKHVDALLSSDSSSEDVKVTKKSKKVDSKKRKVSVVSENSGSVNLLKQKKKKVVKKQESDSESESEVVTKRKPTKKSAKVVDSDDDSSEPVKKSHKKTKEAPKKTKKVVESDSESSEPVKKPTKKTKKVVESDSESSEPVKKPTKKTKKVVESDSESSEPVKKPTKKTKKVVESDSESSENIVQVKKPTAVVEQAVVEEDDHKELFVKNLSWNTTEDSAWEHFSKFGALTNLKLLTDKMTGKPRGIGFVGFEKRSDAKNAMENCGEIDGRAPQLLWSNNKEGGKPAGNAPYQQRAPNTNFSSGYTGETFCIFVGNLGFRTTEDSVRKFFSQSGNVVGVRIAKNEEGRAKGFCHVDFDSVDSAKTAVGLAGRELDGREIRVDMSEPRKNRGEGGFRGGDRGGFRGGDRGGRGGFRGGPPRQSHGPMGGAGKRVTFSDSE